MISLGDSAFNRRQGLFGEIDFSIPGLFGFGVMGNQADLAEHVLGSRIAETVR